MSEPWRHKAACDGQDTNLWFPDTTGPHNPNTARALATCRRCEVQLQCLAYAQDKPELHGIWGGLTEGQRRGMRHGNPPIEHGTRHGYNQHLSYGRPTCRACRTAHAEYQAATRRIRERARTRNQIEEVS